MAIANLEVALPLARELEDWCAAQRLPYDRADDLMGRWFVSASQRAWLAGFKARWDALKASCRPTAS